MGKLQTLIDYARYRITSKDAHGIHSPFVFHLYNEVIASANDFYGYKKLTRVRKQLEMNQTELVIEDFGAGSKVFKNNRRKISEICRHGISAEKYAQLLFRLVNFVSPQTSIELGTSVGLTSMYLATAAQNSTLYTIEGSRELAAFARQQFEQQQIKNIRVLQGSFDEQLPALLGQIKKVDFAYIDGNHAKEPTLRYFEMFLSKCHNDTVLVFDDINWSEGMKAAWQEIKKHADVRLTIDLFFTGIVFFRKEHKEKEHFVLRY